MADADPLRIVEAGYRWIADERRWLCGVADAAAPCGLGTGVAAYTVGLTGAPRIGAFAGRGLAAGFEREVRAFTTGFDRDTARAIYAPTELVGNAAYRLRRIAQARRVAPEQLGRGPTVAAWAMVGGDPRTRAVALAFPAHGRSLAPDRAFPGDRILGLVAAHLGAALRLRQLAAPLTDGDRATESVLSPGGRILDATGDARGRAQRRSLVEAVVRRERARGRLRRVDAGEAAALWSVLVAGRWSIVDFVDRDGKRMLLARANPVAAPDLLALTDHERDVAWLAALGHSNKYIAYELGLSIAMVTRRLTAALRKLRIESRRELLRRFGPS
jgi:DNA-binding CsgD family transcriptional regulator